MRTQFCQALSLTPDNNSPFWKTGSSQATTSTFGKGCELDYTPTTFSPRAEIGLPYSQLEVHASLEVVMLDIKQTPTQTPTASVPDMKNPSSRNSTPSSHSFYCSKKFRQMIQVSKDKNTCSSFSASRTAILTNIAPRDCKFGTK